MSTPSMCISHSYHVNYTWSVSNHSARNPSFNCLVPLCQATITHNTTCRSSSTPCFRYRTENGTNVCANAIDCSILEACDNITSSCQSNTSICIVNTCCSSRKMCLPLMLIHLCLTAFATSINPTLIGTTTTTFTTTSEPALPLDILSNSIVGLWNTVAGGFSQVATMGSSGPGTYFTGQLPSNLLDDSLSSRYSSRGNSSSGNNSLAGLNTGFYATVAQCNPVLVGFILGNAYPDSDREPTAVTIEGSNCYDLATCSNWALLYSGSSGLDSSLNSLSYGDYRSISNNISYTNYRFLATAKRSSSVFVTYGEIKFYGYQNSTRTNARSIGGNLSFIIRSGSIEPLWNTVAGSNSYIATEAASGVGTYYTNQGATNLFDGSLSTKYTTRGNSSSGSNAIAGLNTGFHLIIAQCQPTLVQFRIATSNSNLESDPMTMTVEGSNCSNLTSCSSWTLLYNGSTGLDTTIARQTFGMMQTITSPQNFTAYRFLMTSKRNSTSSIFITYSEVELYGY